MKTWIAYLQTQTSCDDVITGTDPTHLLNALREMTAARTDDPCLGVRRADVPKPIVAEQQNVFESIHGVSCGWTSRGVRNQLAHSRRRQARVEV